MRIRLLVLPVLLLVSGLLAAQSRPDLYDCEGCESIHENSFDGLTWSAAIPPAGEAGDKLVLTGRVYRPDGETPAPGVIVYAYHTNVGGIYPTHGDEKGWGRRHGYLRAWVKTNEAGDYRFDTIRPGSYPSGGIPAHIHMIVKEPDRREYWIDDVIFTDDALVDDGYRRRAQGRGGPGIVTPARDASGTWQVRRDIVLER